MLQPNRNFDSQEYRYGFQGQEIDSELKGEGNSVNYKYRMHDPRVGRFFAVDPLAHQYPWYSSYQFAGNKVIRFVELEGLEEQISPYLEKNDYKPVFKKGSGSFLQRLDNASYNILSVIPNLGVDAYNASSGIINNTYWMFTGQKQYDLHNDLVSPTAAYFTDNIDYHLETPALQQLEDTAEILTDMRTIEVIANLVLSKKVSSTTYKNTTPKNPVYTVLHKNDNNYVGYQAVYQIKIDGKLYKYGKADMTDLSKTTGKPNRLQSQINTLIKENPTKRVSGNVIYENKNISTLDVKKIETKAVQNYVNKNGKFPKGNQNHPGVTIPKE